MRGSESAGGTKKSPYIKSDTLDLCGRGGGVHGLHSRDGKECEKNQTRSEVMLQTICGHALWNGLSEPARGASTEQHMLPSLGTEQKSVS